MGSAILQASSTTDEMPENAARRVVYGVTRHRQVVLSHVSDASTTLILAFAEVATWRTARTGHAQRHSATRYAGTWERAPASCLNDAIFTPDTST